MSGSELLPLIDLGDNSNRNGRPADYLMARPYVPTMVAGLGEALRAGSALPHELAELAVLVVAVQRRSQLGMLVHRRLATAAGVDSAIADSLIAGTPPTVNDRQALVIAVTETLLATGRIPQQQFIDAQERLGDAALADLVAIVGFHLMMAMALNAYSY